MEHMDRVTEQFGLMMYCVGEVRKLSPSVFTVAGDSMIAVTMKMPQ